MFCLMVMQLVIPLSESPYIRVDAEADDEEMVDAALAYYKHELVFSDIALT